MNIKPRLCTIIKDTLIIGIIGVIIILLVKVFK